jgi:hypothetical protein
VCLLHSALWHTRQRAHLHQLHAWPYSTRTGRSGAPTHRESSPESLKLTWNFFARSRGFFCWRGYALRIPLTPWAMARRGQWLRHLRLLVRKNVKLQLRRPKGTVAEILMPTVFIVLLVAIRSLVPVGPPSLNRPSSLSHSAPRLLSCMCELSERAAHPSCRRVRVALPLKALDSCGTLGCETDNSLCGPVLR